MLTDGLQFLAGAVNTNFTLPFTNNLSTIANATRGDLVYNTGINPGLYIHDGATWVLGLDLGPQQATPNVEVTTNKDVVNGYAGLDIHGLLKTASLPAFTGDVISNAGSNTLSLNAVPWSKLSDKPTTLSDFGITETDTLLVGIVNNRVPKSGVNLTAGTSTKITYNSNGLITASGSLGLSDIPDLPWNKITTGKPTSLTGFGITETDPILVAVTENKLNKPNTLLTPGTGIKISYNENGLVTSSATLTANDVPTIPWSKVNNTPTLLTNYGISVADPLLTALDTAKVNKSGVMLTAGTATKITFNASGLIIGSSVLSLADLPAGTLTSTSDLSWSKIITKPTTLTDYGISATDTILTNLVGSIADRDLSIPVVTITTTNYNITIADNGKNLHVNGLDACTIVVPAVDVLTNGKNVTIYNQSAAAATLTIPTGFNVYKEGTTAAVIGGTGGSLTIAQRSKVKLLFTKSTAASAVNEILIEGTFTKV